MPRKSVASIVGVVVNGDPQRLAPPKTLSDDERRVFVELVGACNPRHFVASDLPLLVAFVQAIALSQQSIEAARSNDNALTRWERSTRLMATLATRLRLSVQSRVDPKTLGRMPPPKGATPWV